MKQSWTHYSVGWASIASTVGIGLWVSLSVGRSILPRLTLCNCLRVINRLCYDKCFTVDIMCVKFIASICARASVRACVAASCVCCIVPPPVTSSSGRKLPDISASKVLVSFLATGLLICRVHLSKVIDLS